jgi:methionyl-tRNA formyltransferase
MRLVFAGTPAFARSALEVLLDAGHDIALVLTQPDRPAGRGLQVRVSEVKTLAVQRGLPVQQPATLKSPESQAMLAASGAQAMVVAAYGLILPQAVLDLFPLGCINIHASLLPRWRGAAPIQRAILAGDRETGVCIMRMEAGLDTGPVLLREATPIGPRETAGELHDRLAALGGRCIVNALALLERGALEAVAQPEAGITYAHKIGKQEAELDWMQPAELLDRQIRAFDPVPGCGTTLRGEPIKIWRAQPAPGASSGAGGTVSRVEEHGITVWCGTGALLLRELQRAGGRRLPVGTFLRGCPVSPGERFGT